MYDTLKKRLDATIYFNICSDVFNPQYNAADLLEYMLNDTAMCVNDVLSDKKGSLYNSTCPQRVKVTLHELIDWLSNPMNNVGIDGFIDESSPHNSRSRPIRINYGTLEDLYGEDVFFGYYGNVFKENNEYVMHAFSEVERFNDMSNKYICTGKPQIFKFNTAKGALSLAFRVLANTYPEGTSKEYQLQNNIDVSAIYVGELSWCSLISIGFAEKLHRQFKAADQISDEVWAVAHQDIIKLFMKSLKKLISKYIVRFEYKVTMSKTKLLYMPKPKRLKDIVMVKLINSLNNVSNIKSSRI